MKRRTFAATALTLPALLAACGSGDGSSALRAGSTGQSYPNSYQEEGKLLGFDVEVMETIAANLGTTVEWTNADFAGLMGQLEAKKLDTVANNVAVTPERSEQYEFTEPYSFTGATIVALESTDSLNSLEDLEGHSIAGVLGSNNTVSLEAYVQEKGIDIEIRTFETRDGAMQDLLAGRVDGYINSRGVLLAEIQKSGEPLKFVGDPITVESIAFPFATGSELVAQFNEQIAALLEDGTLAELSTKYYGEDLTVEPATGGDS